MVICDHDSNIHKENYFEHIVRVWETWLENHLKDINLTITSVNLSNTIYCILQQISLFVTMIRISMDPLKSLDIRSMYNCIIKPLNPSSFNPAQIQPNSEEPRIMAIITLCWQMEKVFYVLTKFWKNTIYNESCPNGYVCFNTSRG